MRVRVLYFSTLKAATGGVGEEVIDAAEGTTLELLLVRLTQRHPMLADFRASMMLTRNREWSEAGAVLEDGDEIGLMPPVSGG